MCGFYFEARIKRRACLGACGFVARRPINAFPCERGTRFHSISKHFDTAAARRFWPHAFACIVHTAPHGGVSIARNNAARKAMPRETMSRETMPRGKQCRKPTLPAKRTSRAKPKRVFLFVHHAHLKHIVLLGWPRHHPPDPEQPIPDDSVRDPKHRFLPSGMLLFTTPLVNHHTTFKIAALPQRHRVHNKL